MYRQFTDQEIVQEFKDGNAEVFEVIVERNFSFAYKIAYNILVLHGLL